ncbi:NAD(P)/FAD-dependent oxidoreductase [Streptomyces sp. NPDC020801]|uniref:NAD(P)/FAD-dependent oxidoreductase n=1 Tax=unclassified Streptomyces TaxID=2593676 RepID=UPI0037941594
MSTVIVGAGQAGVQLAVTLRKEGYQQRIVLIGDETEPPYHRPPLSKAFLLGSAAEDTLQLRAESFYRDHAIEVLRGQRVVGIDRSARRVSLANGAQLSWQHLVLATGARPRRLGLPGEDLGGVLPLRTAPQARALREHVASARSVVIVGGGFIGLEFASAVADRCENVVVLEAGDRLMGRAVTEPVSRFFARAHADKGVQVRFGTRPVEFLGRRGEVTAVRTADHRIHPADLVVVGVGVLPNDDLADQAELAVDGGILVGAGLRTADPGVYAIGDCARFPSVHCDAPVRLESVQNAVDQAVHVGRGIVSGQERRYCELPWFWSDQGGLRLQIAGVSAGYDQVQVFGEPADGRFSVFAFRRGRLSAVESVNRPAEHVAARRLLSTAGELTAEQAAVPGFNLRAFVAQASPLATRSGRC